MTMWIPGKGDHNTRKDNLFTDLYQECKLAPPAARLSYAIRVRLERFLLPERREIACRMKEGCSPLFIACKKGNVEIVEYLITVCNADVEQRGRYEVPDDRSVHNVTPLWCAAVAGKLPVVKCLVQYGANVDSMSDTGSTPVRSACFMTHLEIVTFLVESGANILRANYNGGTCLINSVQSVPLCEYLLKHGAAVNALDIQQKTALHYAIQEHRLETTKLLLQYKADPYLKSRYGDDSLQTSCLKGATQIFEYLIANVPYSLERVADAYELMGSTCLDEHHDSQLALKFWRAAVQLRNSSNGPPILKTVQPPTEHFNNVVEFQTMEELENLSADVDQMRIQSLLICERILGPTHKDAIFRFMYRGAAYADSLRYQQCIDLWKYALELRVRKDTLLYNETCFAARALVRIFLDLHEKHEYGILREPLRSKDVLSAFTLLVDNMESSLELLYVRPIFRRHQDNFDRILNCLSHLLFLLTTASSGSEEEYHPTVTELVRRLVRIDPRNSAGESLLHLAASRDNTIKSSSYFDEPQGAFFPSIRVAKILLDCGANVSSLDQKRNTPLHTAVKPQNYEAPLVELLLRRGAHIDQVNADGERPANMLVKIPGGSTIHPLEHISLQCLAASAVKAYRLVYKGECPVTLESFIELH